MRVRLYLSAAVLLCVWLFGTPVAPAANGPETVMYFDRANQAVIRAAAPKLRAHFDALSRSKPVKLTYRLRASGALEAVRVTSGDPNSLVAQTFTHAIRSAKFPPIPKAVLKEQGKSWLDINLTFGPLNNIPR